MHLRFAGAFLAAACLAAAPAFAEPVSLGGHSLEVIETDAGQALLVDGAMAHENGVIYLEPVPHEVGGVTVLIGSAGSGGNTCNASPFVLSLQAEGFRLDGPTDSCAHLEQAIGADAVDFTSAPSAAWEGEHWRWTPSGGIQRLEPAAFAPDPSKGWDDLASLDGAHPIDVWAFGPIRQQMLDLLGEAETDSFLQVISGIGSGGLKAPGYVGYACDKFDCQQTYGVLILDADTRQPYLAWTLSGGQLMTRPEGLENWSPAALKALEEWGEEF